MRTSTRAESNSLYALFTIGWTICSIVLLEQLSTNVARDLQEQNPISASIILIIISGFVTVGMDKGSDRSLSFIWWLSTSFLYFIIRLVFRIVMAILSRIPLSLIILMLLIGVAIVVFIIRRLFPRNKENVKNSEKLLSDEKIKAH